MRRNKGKHSLPEWAIRRPVTMSMMFLSMLVIGIMAFNRIPIALLPTGLDLPYLWLWFVYPNSSPVENLDRIGKPVEESLATVKGINRIVARADENRCRVMLEFQQNVDMDVAYLEVQDRIERVKPDLPDDLRYIYVYRYSDTDEPVVYFAISVHGNYDDPYRLVQEQVVKRLERIDGVAAIEIWGGAPKLIRIEFKLDKLKINRIEIISLLNQLRESDFTVSGGNVTEGGKLLYVRSEARLRSIDDIKNLPIKGSKVRLEDVAEVSYSENKTQWIQRVNRQDAIQMGVFKESDANTVDVCSKVSEVIDEFQLNPALRGMKFNILFNQGEFITDSLFNLEESGLWGGFFAVLVLIFFLRRLRMTFMITLAIPFSLMITISTLYFMGWSLNVVTLSGLMICVGMVVDNAIVVVENINAMQRSGLSNREAAIKGAAEVGQAITIATLTTVVVFLPLMIMGENRIFSFYLLRIGVPVIIALLASLLMALLFIPLAVQRISLSKKDVENKIIDRMTCSVEKMVEITLRNRRDVFLILLILLGSIAWPMSKVISTDQEEGHINDFTLRFNFPQYYTLEDITNIIVTCEDTLYAHSGQYDIKTVVSGYRRGNGRIRVFLNVNTTAGWMAQGIDRLRRRFNIGRDKRLLDRKEILEDVAKRITVPPGVVMHTSWESGGSIKETYITLFGDDTQKLMNISRDVQRRLLVLPDVLAVENDIEQSSEEIQILFDRDKSSRLGVDPGTSARGLASLIRGVELPDIRIGDYEIDARAELMESDRRTLDQILGLPVVSSAGVVHRLDDVADIGYDRGISEITRENRRTRIQLKISATGEDIEKLSENIDDAMKSLVLPVGYSWGKGQRFTDVAESSGQRNEAWMLAVAFVFLLMGALFESVLLPWSVIVTVPFSFIGVWWFLYLTGTQFGVMSGVGVIILIGVVVNNAIVLVDKANKLITEGHERDKALALAARLRLRPIMMTAMTTIMGLIPMAIGDSNLIGIPYAPMGRTIIGGMLTATITTPIVVPLMYSLLDDTRMWFNGIAVKYRQSYKD